MVQFILGKTGTGKTKMVLDRAMACARMGQQVLLLVPEQSSFETEKAVFTVLSGSDALRINVLSFSRLSENIFRACGGLSRKRLTDTARLVLMKIALREMGDSLTVYQRQSGRTAFVSTMLETVKELKSCGAGPDDLNAAALAVEDRQLKAKLRDISAIYGAYQAIVDRDYDDPLDDLAKAGQLAEEHGYFRGMTIFLDGFDFFSPPERALIQLMEEQAWQVTIALCADGLAQKGETDIFLSQKKTARRLYTYAREHGIPVEAPVNLTENLRTGVPVLRMMEELLSGGEPEAPEDLSGLRCVACRDKYAEARFAAAEICRLVREEGLRYRDIALVCRSMEEYGPPLEAAVSEYGIPAFFDRKEPVLTRPVAAVLTAALEAVRSRAKTEAVLRIARSPAMGLESSQVARLENYCYVWSVEGGGWERPFRNDPAGLTGASPESYQKELEEAESARRKVIEPLLRLKKRLAGCDGRTFALSLYQYLEDIRAAENLRAYFAGDSAESLAMAQQNDALWEMIVDVLDIFADSLSRVRYPLGVFAELFQMALASLELGQIPNTMDQAIVGSADRVRLRSPRAVFALGVNEGVFPMPYQPYGVFTDGERSALIQRGIELSTPGLEWSLLERFYLYSTLCAPRQSLYVTWSVADLRGGAAEPSMVVTQLFHLCPSVFLSGEELPAEFFVADLETAMGQYAGLCGSGTREESSVRSLLEQVGEDSFVQAMERAGQDLSAEGLAPATAAGLLGGQVRLSPTRIENFYRCPYLFLCDSLLGLRPRRRVEYTPLESGTAIHYVLEMLLKEVGSQGIAGLGDEELRKKVEGLLEEYIRKMVSDTSQLASRFRYQFQRLVMVLFTIIRHIGSDFDQSLFAAVGMEVPVGPDGRIHPKPMAAEDGTPVVIHGKIDRVDVFRNGQEQYARVIDYKSGGKDFRLEDVVHGLNMQMLVYLFALCDDESAPYGPVRPAGILYMPGKLLAAEVAPGAGDESARQAVEISLKMKGMLLDDETVLRAMERELEGKYIPARLKKGSDQLTSASRVKTKEEFEAIRKMVYDNIREMADHLVRGEVEPMPVRSASLNPCDNCAYGLLCNNRGTERYKDLTDVEGKEGEEDSHG